MKTFIISIIIIIISSSSMEYKVVVLFLVSCLQLWEGTVTLSKILSSKDLLIKSQGCLLPSLLAISLACISILLMKSTY